MTTTPAPTLPPVTAARRPARSRSLRPWYRNGSLVAGMVIVGALILVAVFAPLITSYSPTTQNLDRRAPGAERRALARHRPVRPGRASPGWSGQPASTCASASSRC